MLSNTLELTLKKALSIATEYKHEYATYEHLLLALIDDYDVKQVLIENKVSIEQLNSELIHYLKNELIELVNTKVTDSKPTAGFQRVIQRAALHTQASGQRNVCGIHVLAEFFFEQGTYALECLKNAHVERQDILNYIQEKLINDDSDTIKPEHQALIDKTTLHKLDQVQNSNQTDSSEIEESELEKYCINLNKRADKDAIDCLIGRQHEIQRAIEILCRRRKNNAILVGEPGVGKTAIAEGLATRIVKKDVPDILKNTVIYSLDIGSLVAGTKFRGDFEERVKIMLEVLRKNKNAILFIDEIHTIIGAGSTTTGALDASNLLKPALAKGELRCIGSTTFKEYHNHFEQDMALVRRFQKIVVKEPDEKATMNILQGLKGYYEKHHKVSYDDSALKAAVTLSKRYIHDRHLPDKAIDLMDEVGSRSKTNNKNSKTQNIITEKDVEELVTSILNIPNLSIAANDTNHLKTLESKLKNNIFGQDAAIENLCNSIKLSRAGLKKGSRPTGCYLFVGPSGVGKTELAKQLANFSNMKLLKFDMSEFSENSSVSKLLGSAPGYVGYEQGGMLTEEVDKYPYSVVLFDEIEKANPEIFSLLLQIMDEGKLTDSTGKNINFTHSMIILTSNTGSEQAKTSIGFNSSSKKQEADSEKIIEELNKQFSPEFRNRLDKMILFNPIDNIISKIVDKNIKELASQLADKKVRLKVSSAVKKHFITNCFNKQNGARDLDRIIDSEIKQFIADEILFGKLKHGGVVNVSLTRKNKITFKFSEAKQPQKKQTETT